MSSKVKALATTIVEAMEHPGFSIVHVQSPCTTYNDTYELLKGSVKKGIEPQAWAIPDDHDSSDMRAATELLSRGGIPLGLLYKDTTRPDFQSRIDSMTKMSGSKSTEDFLDLLAI